MTAHGTSQGFDESVLVIGPTGSELVGVLAQPAEAARTKDVGVVIVVGGPQTRVGSHRQFVLMARALARAGYACLRFDYTGMGDSPGSRPDFERAGPDIRRACDAMVAAVPGCRKLALWGLCDGASAALFYAPGDPRVAAVIAANPWARSDTTRSAALVSGHYGSRLRSADFWKKLLAGKVDLLGAAREALGHLMRSRGRYDPASEAGQPEDLPARLAGVIATWGGRLRLQLSGRDLTAAEFEIAMDRCGLPRGGTEGGIRIDDADHTFSDPLHWEAAIADAKDALARI